MTRYLPVGEWVTKAGSVPLFARVSEIRAVPYESLEPGPDTSVRLSRPPEDVVTAEPEELAEGTRLPCGCPVMDFWDWLEPCPGHVWTHWHPHRVEDLAEYRFCFYCGEMEAQRLRTEGP